MKQWLLTVVASGALASILVGAGWFIFYLVAGDPGPVVDGGAP